MKRQQLIRFYFVAVGLLLLAACATNRVNYSTLEPDDLYQRATTAFDSGHYGDAIPMLQAFVNGHLADSRAPQAQLMLGQSHMKRKEYITAAAEFQRLVEDFPGSQLNLQARFAICDAYNHLSPKPALDQEYTSAALAHCESVAAGFPGTPEAEKATVIVTDLSEKLAEKDFNTAMFYFKRKAYDAAVVYFNDVVTNFSQSTYAPKALSELMKTYDILGYVEESAQAKSRLLANYSDSPEAHAAQP